MREIKFRDYDAENKCMRYFTLDSYDRETHNSFGNIMQYTGLKDRDGKEIYEGDIVKLEVQTYGYDGIEDEPYALSGEVIFSEGCYTVIDNTRKTKWAGGVGPALGGSCEVIGNVFENPELLNEKTV